MEISSKLIIGVLIIALVYYIASRVFELLENDRQIEELRKKIENSNKYSLDLDEDDSDRISVEKALKKWDKGDI